MLGMGVNIAHSFTITLMMRPYGLRMLRQYPEKNCSTTHLHVLKVEYFQLGNLEILEFVVYSLPWGPLQPAWSSRVHSRPV